MRGRSPIPTSDQCHDGQRLNQHRQAQCLSHIGGALGAALLELMLKRGWANRHLDSRALSVTSKGSDAMARLFAVRG